MTERSWIIFIICIAVIFLAALLADFLRKRRVDKDRSPKALVEAAKAADVSLKELCDALTILDRGITVEEATRIIDKDKERKDNGRETWY